MTDLLERAVSTARSLPRERQDDIARVILALAAEGGRDATPLTADERQAIARSRAAGADGDFASDKEIAAVWAKHGL